MEGAPDGRPGRDCAADAVSGRRGETAVGQQELRQLSGWWSRDPHRAAYEAIQQRPRLLPRLELLALAGRDEARDFVDILDLHERVLALGALCWAAAGKDPGFTPLALLEILQRRGKHHADDFARLRLEGPLDLPAMKTKWLAALADAETFIRSRPPDEMGCLYYSASLERFVTPAPGAAGDAVPHFGRPGGVLPRVIDSEP